MSASLQVALCIGNLKKCFLAYDEVKLLLKDGTIVKGILLPMKNTRFVELNTDKGVRVIYPDDIEDYLI